MVKNPPANAGDRGSIPGLRRSAGVGSSSPLLYSSLGIPRTEETGGLQSVGSQRLRHGEATEHTHMRVSRKFRTLVFVCSFVCLIHEVH